MAIKWVVVQYSVSMHSDVTATVLSLLN